MTGPTPENAAFWRDRLKEHDHTGWSSRIIYPFDQLCRLNAFAAWLDATMPRPGRALDFGCGVGDFAQLLLARGWSVVGFDPFVRPPILDAKFTGTQELAEIESFAPYDLVVSITVLDHLLNDADFAERLSMLRRTIAPGGRFFFP